MKAIIEYSKIKEVEIKKIEIKKTPTVYIYLRFFFIIMIITLLAIDCEYGVPIGIYFVLSVYLCKFIKDKKRKEQFTFLPDPDKNYVDMPYKTKLQAIDFKVTCHPEANPVRIMQDESYRKYVFSNTSNSILNNLI